MRQGQNFRVNKRGLASTQATSARDDDATTAPPLAEATATPVGFEPTATRAHAEREMRRVVAGWVSEHRRASEELRRALSHALLLRA
ncbi:MAG: hypothetical protein LC746_02550 [Acidobacteria bacterium]|nr:hypothetical protein [Acidobacteriota bacterium]